MSKQIRVFLSHSSLDKPFVRSLDRALNGFGVETFLDERDIGLGEDIPHRIYKEISQASHVCYIISPNSINSEWVKEELSTAKMIEKERGGVFLLPILLADVDIPPSFKSKRYADFRNIDGDGINVHSKAFQLLLQALGIDLDKHISPSHLTAQLRGDQKFERLMLISSQIQIPLCRLTGELKRVNDILRHFHDRTRTGTLQHENSYALKEIVYMIHFLRWHPYADIDGRLKNFREELSEYDRDKLTVHLQEAIILLGFKVEAVRKVLENDPLKKVSLLFPSDPSSINAEDSIDLGQMAIEMWEYEVKADELAYSNSRFLFEGLFLLSSSQDRLKWKADGKPIDEKE